MGSGASKEKHPPGDPPVVTGTDSGHDNGQEVPSKLNTDVVAQQSIASPTSATTTPTPVPAPPSQTTATATTATPKPAPGTGTGTGTGTGKPTGKPPLPVVPGRTVTSVSHTSPVAPKGGFRPYDDDHDAGRMPVARGTGVDGDPTTTRPTPRFDKEKFKKANKDPGHLHHHNHALEDDIQPAGLTHFSHHNTTNGKDDATDEERAAFLNDSDEDFMAAILKETDFVARERNPI
ncbi:hypothetical protein HKX48_009114 [Thoreauomyces humboldtii]|nr:hypothetical protein HKX48_009114 [Thoreauomyces humboldtii]